MNLWTFKYERSFEDGHKSPETFLVVAPTETLARAAYANFKAGSYWPAGLWKDGSATSSPAINLILAIGHQSSGVTLP